ncbi:UDP-N-acetylglucosamine 2-epimerase (non-hydrolyzing) [Halanaerobium sp. Z-7514]|uniref:UDP-N-acetylglucosamine 2-epimerase (non-hydrolyzing) n=1 Tax=Halanaerobium polyolivorans TaxID=2886943 RepID=A0AAW4X018_9FIRM|nr:UDP-N-acetylglucosamine 2-epimerase (non-hydrolyzing) [Halanaerobium polyolivorans]MCC3144481.1 UDP-N-acetylglucosamine 2-epimerase (non-hydrolyzing) [Halanaerobium polyolivorans]RQD74834.1 MAG: UDP-N-acetylglucosamine 2-epimerase (non-hydrolyzing) [Halanaerobium sp. MSAO_Bac5]
MKKKIMAVFGTRPEAIKMAPLLKKLENKKNYHLVITVTAQHREMLDQVLNLFALEADYDLDIMQPKQTLSEVTARILNNLAAVLEKEKPELLLVHGDTSTTFVSALASFYQQINIAHIEAGLRTHVKYSPFPEEINRQLTGVLADLHFAPTKRAAQNLIKENIEQEKIYISGNTVIDALLSVVDDNYNFQNPVLKEIDFTKKDVLLLTAHRRENLGEPMENIFRAVRDLTAELPNLEVVFPVHLNPLIRELSKKMLADNSRIHLIEPLDYLPFVNLMARSKIVLTDSGGIQEEAPSLAKPVLVLRDTTERPEALEAGTVLKVGTDYQAIYQQSLKLLKDEAEYQKRAAALNPYGDGKAAQRIVNALDHYFGFSQNRPADFQA